MLGALKVINAQLTLKTVFYTIYFIIKQMKTIHYYFKTIAVTAVLVFTYPLMAQDWYDMAIQDHANYYEVKKAGEKYFDSHGRGKGSGYKLFARWLYFAKRNMLDDGTVPSASEVMEAKQKFDNAYFQKKEKAAFAGDWKELGPFSWRRTTGWNPGVGRIVSLDVSTTNADLIFAGSPGGGIWRTTNGGNKWVPLGDNLSNLHIYGVGIDPFNNNNIYMLNSAGRILKSTNQGDSWTEIFNTGRQVARSMSIVFHPNQEGTLLVASPNGVYKSTNSGGSFTRVLTSGVEDVAYRPNDPNTVYACGSRFYKSTNGGNSFQQKSAGIVSTERLRLSVTPANNNYVYLVQKSGSSFGHFYRSTNSGESFQERSASSPPYFTQANRDMAIMASWTNPEEVHVAGMNNHRTRNGGNNFSELATWSSPNDPSYIHADVEVMKCINNVLYTGSDGGIFRSTNGGDNYTDLSSLGGLSVHQFYRIAGTPQDVNMMMGGSQDNGANIMKNKDKEWISWLGADGMEVGIDYTNKNIIYGATQFGGFNKSTDGGNSRRGMDTPGQGNWVTPFEIDPINHNTLYVGLSELYKSTNAGGNWTSLTNSINIGGNLDEVTIAPTNNQYIYISRGDRIWRTTNGGGNWTQLSGTQGNINYIAVDPNDHNRVAVACGGSRVFTSTNAGSNWTNRKMNLPGSGANCVIYDAESNNGLYVGTENAVYYTNDGLSEWMPFSNGLPKTRVNELDIHYATKTLRIGTYGRGMWETGMAGSSLSASITSLGDFIFCEGDDVALKATVEGQANGSFTYQWKRNGQNINGATSETYRANVAGDYTVFISNGDADGESDAFAVQVIEKPTAPSIVMTPSCGPGTVALKASENNDNEINWYTSSNATTAAFTGTDYDLNLTVSTTLYVEARTKGINGNVGLAAIETANGGSHAGGFFLVFDVEKPMRLKKAKVFAYGAKARTLELRDASDILIESKEIFIADGESVIDVDLVIPAGNDYKIGFAAGADMFRSNAGISYPYALDGLVNIKASTAGTDPTGFYYYLYNWEVSEIYPECIGDRQSVEAVVVQKPENPQANDLNPECGENGPYTLTATGGNGEFRWYETATATQVLEKGSDLTIPSLEETEDYFVEEVALEKQTAFGGPADNTFGGGGIHAGGFYLIFDATQDFTLKTAKVYAEEAKERTLELRDSEGNVVNSKIINIPAGESKIDIDMEIKAGANQQIGFAAGADIYRNNENVSFPYKVGDVATIKETTAGTDPTGFYYYLYDWNVSYDGFECASSRSKATITIQICLGVNDANNIVGSMNVYPNPVAEGLHIELKENLNIASMKLVDVFGRSVYETNKFEEYISVDDISNGNYVLILKSEDGRSAVYNVLIQK